ncbi:MAG: hypothetical protein MUP82_03950 [Candidatus Marinimicrobia bacterium]|nr:hypothetical protein [Candidatus Neomarinimicrobiota bacterium]
MKNGIHINTILQNITLLICVYFIFTAGNCQGVIDHLEDDSDHCEVVINGPASTVFTENDDITFSARLEKWEYLDDDDDNYDRYPYHKEPKLYGVRWTSDDVTIYTQEYNVRNVADPSFSINTLTPGNHTIRCYALDDLHHNTCYDEIHIEIDEAIEPENQIERVEFGVTLDNADTKLTLTSSSVSYGTGFGGSLNSDFGTISFSNNVYTTVFDNDSYAGSTYNGYMTITFFEEPRRVDIQADWSEAAGDCVEYYIIDYDGIPFDQSIYSTIDWDEYSERGSSVSRINVSNERICDWGTRELLNTNCGEDATISVNVYYVE